MSTENLPAITVDYCIKEFGYSTEEFQVLRQVFLKDLTLAEICVFAQVCKQTGLDPRLKQIYAIKRPQKQKDGSYKDVMTVQTAIDGYRSIGERTGKYAPGREPVFKYNIDKETGQQKLFSATAYVKKMTTDGIWHEVAATAYFAEYYSNKGGFWDRMPHGQLAKCAEVLAIRKSFPDQCSGIRSDEEMAQADIEILSQQLKNPEPTIDNQIKKEPPRLIEEQVADVSKPLTIDKDQMQELTNILQNVPANIKANIQSQFKISFMNQIKVDDFEKVKNAIIQIKKINNIG